MGMFDDLVPQQAKPSSGMFDDLVPQKRGVLEGIVSDVKHALGYERTPEEQAQAEQAHADFAQGNADDSASTRAKLTGATFGVFPRIEAAVEAAFTDKDYDKSLEDIRKDQLEWAERNPGTALADEILGGILVPGSIGVATGQRAGAAVAATTGSRAAGTAASLAVPGAIVGGGYGVGASEDWGDVGQTAADGLEAAGWGAVAGPAFAGAANGVWGLAKGVGRGVRDMTGRVAERFGADATPAATRILASVAEGDGVARLPGVSRAGARRSAADLQNAVDAAHVNGVDDTLVAADRRIAALTENLAGQSWMPDQPFDDFARRALDGQQDRVAQGVADTLRGAPGTNHTANMADLEYQRAGAFDPRYDRVRAGTLAGSQGNMQVTGLYQIADENPQVFAKYFEEALGDVVSDQRVQFTPDDAQGIFGMTRGDRNLVEAHELAQANKADADFVLAQARADLSDAELARAGVQQARDAFDVAQNGSFHADVALRDAAIAAANVQRQPRLITTNMHPAVAERFYARLSEAANGGDQQALRVLEQYKGSLRGTAKGRELMELKEDHAAAFSRLDSAQKGETIWGKSGTKRSEAMREMQGMDGAGQAAFTEAAAGSAGMRVAGDTGSFSRPNNLVGSTENRGTMDQLFGAPNRDAAQDLINREGHLHDTVGRMSKAREQGVGATDPDSFVGNMLKMGVQWQFTPSVAVLNAYRRTMTGITQQRGAAIAQMSMDPAAVRRVQDQMRAWQATRERAMPRARALSGLSQIDTTDDPEE